MIFARHLRPGHRLRGIAMLLGALVLALAPLLAADATPAAAATAGPHRMAMTQNAMLHDAADCPMQMAAPRPSDRGGRSMPAGLHCLASCLAAAGVTMPEPPALAAASRQPAHLPRPALRPAMPSRASALEPPPPRRA